MIFKRTHRYDLRYFISFFQSCRDLTDNDYTNFSDHKLKDVKGLVKLDLRDNAGIDEIPFFYDNLHMRRVYVDSGFTCCIFEMEYEPDKGE